MNHIRLIVLMAGVIVTPPARLSPMLPLLGQVSAQRSALDFLKGLPRAWWGTSARDCKTYEHKNIERLSRPFAAAAANFLKAFVEIHGHVTITSAHRTAQEQACVCLGEKGPCAGKSRVVKAKKGRRTVRRGGCRTINMALRSMFAPEPAAMKSSSACMSLLRSIRNSEYDFRWAKGIGRIWSQWPSRTQRLDWPLWNPCEAQ